ncbi:Hypothetical protein, putative [Bodo saltans]|uniref:Uncharacterized protein n=1 Tax=Bodo saltans TaxID=75058 RepID=A0A0S4JEB3_BODSA|nr:Hypothetical protein, putative [Bodo saltans]|eukprot:CUG86705.1 Hypothetical protein, putative [Bodo saltans]
MLKALLTSHQRPRVLDLLTALENNPELASDAARKVRKGLEALRQSSTFVKFAIGRYTRAVRVVQQLIRRLFARNIAMRQRALHEWGKRQEQLWSSSNAGAATRRPPSEAVRERVIREEFAEQRRRHASIWRVWRKMQLSLQSQLREVTTELHSAIERTSISPIALKHLQDRMAFLNHRLQHHDTAQPRYQRLEVDLVALDTRVAVVMRKEATERVASAMDAIGVHTEDAAFMDTVVRRYEEVLEAEHARKRLQHNPTLFHGNGTSGGGRRRTLHTVGISQNGAAAIAAMTRKKSHSIISAQRVLTQPAAQVLALSSIVAGGTSAMGTTAIAGASGEGSLHRLSSSLSMSSVTTKLSTVTSHNTLEPQSMTSPSKQGGGGLQRRPSRSRLIRFDSAEMVPAENSFLPSSIPMEPLPIPDTKQETKKSMKPLESTLTLSIVAPEYPEHNGDLGLSILTPKDRRKFSSLRGSASETLSPEFKSGGVRTGSGFRPTDTAAARNDHDDATLGNLHEPRSPPKLSIAARQCFKALGISLDSLAFPVEGPGVNKFSEFVHAARVVSGFPEPIPASNAKLQEPAQQLSSPRQHTASPRSSPRSLVVKQLPRCPPRQPHQDRGIDLHSPRMNRSARLRHKAPQMAPLPLELFTLATGNTGAGGGRHDDLVNDNFDEVAPPVTATAAPTIVTPPEVAPLTLHAMTRKASPPRKRKTDTNLEGCRNVFRERYRKQHPPPRPPIDLPEPIPLEWLARPPSPPFSLIDEALAADLHDDGSVKNIVTITVAPEEQHAADAATGADALLPLVQPAATFGVVSIMTDGTVRVDGLDPKAYSAKHCHSPQTFSSRGSSAAASLSLMPVATLPTLSRVVNAIHMLDMAPPTSHSQSSMERTPQSMIAVACSDGSLRVYSLRNEMQETLMFSDCPTSREPFTAIETCGNMYLCVSCEDNTVYTYVFGEAHAQPQPQPAATSQQHNVHHHHQHNSPSPLSALRGVTLVASPSSSASIGAVPSAVPSRHASPQLTKRVSHVNGASRTQRPGSASSRTWTSWGKLPQPTTITHMVAVTPATSASSFAAQSASQSAAPVKCILAVASYDHAILLWDIQESSILTKLEDHTQGVHHMFISRSTHQLVSCSYDSTVRMWDVLSGADDTTSLASSQNHDPSKPLPAAGGFYRVAGGLSSEPSVAQADAFVSAASSPMLPRGGRRTQFHHTVRSVDSDTATFEGGDDNMPFPGSPSVLSEDVRSGGGGMYPSTVYAQHRQAVLHAVDVSGKDRLIASISQDNTIQMWDQLTLEAHFIISDVPGNLFIGCVAFPAASLLAYAFADNTLRVFSSSSGKLQSETKLQHPPKAVVKLSHQGLMGVGSTSGHVRVFNAEAGHFVTTSDKLHNFSVTCMSAIGPRDASTHATTSHSSPQQQHLSLLVTGGEDREHVYSA